MAGAPPSVQDCHDDPETPEDVKEMRRPTYENHVLSAVGQFGLYQRLVFTCLTLSDVPAGMTMLYFIFANGNPGAKCRRYEENMTYEQNVTSSRANDVCDMNGTKCVEFEFDEAYSSIVSEWDLICGNNFIPQLTVTIQFIGLIIGATVTGQLADLYGRKRLCLVVNSMMMLTQVLVGFSVNWQMYATLRFFAGMFAGSVLGITFVMPLEFVGPKWRPFCGCLNVFTMGYSLMCLIAYLVHDWRYLSYITGTIGIPLLFLLAFFVPESPRWLIQKGHFKEAEALILKMARYNKRLPPDMKVLRKICVQDAEEKEAASRYTYLDLFSTKKFAVRTLVLIFICFTVSEVYYGIALQISSFTGNIYLNAFISSCVSLPFVWSAIPISAWLGRKKSYLLYNAIGVVCMLLILVLNATGHLATNPYLITGLALTGKGAINAMWNITMILNTELYPTLMRSIANGAGNLSSRIGGVLAPQFAYLGMIIHWTIPYIIHGTLAICCAFLAILFIPETHNKPLPENPPPRKGKHKGITKMPAENVAFVESQPHLDVVEEGEEEEIKRTEL